MVSTTILLGFVLLLCSTTSILGFNISSCPCFTRQNIKVAVIAHSMNTDPYWSAIKAGATDAAQYRGIQVEFYDTPFMDVNIILSNIQAALSKSTPGDVLDGIVVSAVNMDNAAISSALLQAKKDGIIVIGVGGDTNEAQNTRELLRTEAPTHVIFGQDEANVAVNVSSIIVAGWNRTENATRQVLCVVISSDAPVLTSRCEYLSSKLNTLIANEGIAGEVVVNTLLVSIEVTQFAIAAVTQKVAAMGRVDGVVITSGVATSFTLTGLGSTTGYHTVVYDTTTNSLGGLTSEKIHTVITSQPYMQGYLATSFIYTYNISRTIPVNPGIRTGPMLLEKDDASDPMRVCEASGYSTGCGNSDEIKKIIMVSCGRDYSAFWEHFNYGAKLAMGDLPSGFNSTFLQNSVFDLQWQNSMINDTMRSNPAGMALCPIDASLEPMIAEVVHHNIPFVTFAAGRSFSERIGKLFIASDEVLAGRLAAEKLLELGSTRGLCVNHIYGNLATVGQCDTFIKVFNDAGYLAEMIYVTVVTASSTIQTYLSTTPADGLFLTSYSILSGVQTGARQAGVNVKIGTVDGDVSYIPTVQSGQVVFTLAQQQFLMGYYSFTMMELLLRTGSYLIESSLTSGPLVVTNTTEQDFCQWSPVVECPTTGLVDSTTGNPESLIVSSDALSTGALAGIIVALILVALAGAIGFAFFMKSRQHMRTTVAAIQQVNEAHKKNYKIEYSELKCNHKIGTGNFGDVFIGEFRSTEVAIKKLKYQKVQQAQLDDFAREVGVMVGLRHPNILLFMGASTEPPNLCIITEYMVRGSLYKILQDSHFHINHSLIKSMALDIIKGLQFIHSSGMLHRDLKSPNLLVNKHWNIKVADFGLTSLKEISKDQSNEVLSLPWSAPEVLKGDTYTAESDIYSFGIILWEMFAKQTPYESMNTSAIPNAIISGTRPTIPDNHDWPEGFVSLMTDCWKGDPKTRPNLAQIRSRLEELEVEEMDSMYDASNGTSTSTFARKGAGVIAPTGKVTLVFTDVVKSTELWEWDPRVMLAALMEHNSVVRHKHPMYNGYEVKTEGDAFIMAFSSSVDAANWCMDVQESLLKADWPPELLDHMEGQPQFDELEHNLLWKGLKVRMGMHTGTPHSNLDPFTGRVDYFGTVVNQTARVCSTASGGQIMISDTVLQELTALQSKGLLPHKITDLGRFKLKGINSSVQLYQIAPVSLQGREFDTDFAQNGFNPTTKTLSASTVSLNLSTSIGAGSDEVSSILKSQGQWVIDFTDLQIGERIGAGSYGEVSSATWNGKKVAVKQLFQTTLKSDQMLILRSEATIMGSLNHKNIIQFYGMCIRPPHLALVTEHLSRGSLEAVLANRNINLPWPRRLDLIKGIAEGMRYLHSQQIIHRDLKSGNLLINDDWEIKIADFGISRIKSAQHTMTQCGTVNWTAPEIFNGAHYNEKADVYSFAVVMWEIITRQQPWKGIHAMRVTHYVTSGEHLSMPSSEEFNATIPSQLIHVMNRCWETDPDKRPSFSDVVKRLDEIF